MSERINILHERKTTHITSRGMDLFHAVGWQVSYGRKFSTHSRMLITSSKECPRVVTKLSRNGIHESYNFV